MTEVAALQDRIWIPIDPSDVPLLEELLRKANPLLATSLDLEDPYSLEPWLVNRVEDAIQVRVHLDRNLISRIVSLARGEPVRQPDEEVFRLAAACMAFLITGGAMIEPSTALYEHAASAGSEASNVQLRDFRVADHIHPQAYLDVALGRQNDIPEWVLTRARDLVDSRPQSDPPVNFEMPLRHRRRHLLILTKIAVLERGPGSRMDKMRRLLEWMATDAYFQALPTLFAYIYFGKSRPKRLLKGVHSGSIVKCKAGLNNAAWDLAYLSYWADEAKQSDPGRLSVLCSGDRALLDIGRAAAVPRGRVSSFAGRSELLRSRWGTSDARRLERLHDDLERTVKSDPERDSVLRDRLARLDDLQSEIDRELAETFR